MHEKQKLTRRIQRLKNEDRQRQYIQESQTKLKQHSVFIALAQAAEQALPNDEFRKQRP
ncbi:MAG: hypothetical protein WBE34_18600 [Candidatus Nitrosopolaris sp.]